MEKYKVEVVRRFYIVDELEVEAVSEDAALFTAEKQANEIIPDLERLRFEEMESNILED